MKSIINYVLLASMICYGRSGVLAAPISIPPPFPSQVSPNVGAREFGLSSRELHAYEILKARAMDSKTMETRGYDLYRRDPMRQHEDKGGNPPPRSPPPGPSHPPPPGITRLNRPPPGPSRLGRPPPVPAQPAAAPPAPAPHVANPPLHNPPQDEYRPMYHAMSSSKVFPAVSFIFETYDNIFELISCFFLDFS